MTQVEDDPLDPDNRHLEFANNAAALDDFFGFIVTYTCTIPVSLDGFRVPFHRSEFPMKETFVWLRANAAVEGLPVAYTDDSLHDEGTVDKLFFGFEEQPAGSGDWKIVVSQRVCERLEAGGEELVVRYGYAHLVR